MTSSVDKSSDNDCTKGLGWDEVGGGWGEAGAALSDELGLVRRAGVSGHRDSGASGAAQSQPVMTTINRA